MAQTPDEPLTLTVHSLPTPAGANGVNTRVGRWKMLLILMVCAAPVIASYFTYYVIRPEGRRNYGELVAAQPMLPELQAHNTQGETVPLSSLKGQWLLVSVADSRCDEACEKHLYLQRQLRETLGREKDRMDWVWLRTGAADLREPLRQATAAATVLHVDAAALGEWLKPAAGHRLEEHLYVVDPMGHWMMRFPANIDPARAKRDLDRLLRASSSWDKAGRENDPGV
jgi:hypothetical protein